MKIVSWNVNGLRALHRKGNWGDAFALSPDVLCLQEIKAHEDQLPEDVLNKSGFHAFFNPSQTKRGYSGTALYSKRKPLDVSYGLPVAITEKHQLFTDGYGEANREGRVITAEFPEFFVVTVYTPNVRDDLSRLPLRYQHWDPAFLEYCVTLQKKKPVVFCGDLNVAHTPLDLARPKENEGRKGFTKEEREGIDNMITEGFTDTFRMFFEGDGHYTWWSPWGGARTRNVGWRLDYIFVGEQLEGSVESAAIHPNVFGSDHCPVSVDLVL